MKICLSPYRKYLLSTILAPLLVVLTLILLHQFEISKALSSVLFFLAFIAILSLILYSTSLSCPKCKQKIACNRDGHCFLPFDLSALDGIVWHHCKQCDYDLSRCETTPPPFEGT